MEPIDYLRTLVRRWPVIAVVALAGALLAFFGTEAKPTPVSLTYRSTHTLLVNSNQGILNTTPIGTITFAQLPIFATVGEVPRLVAQQLSYPGPPAALAAQVQVAVDEQTGTLTFTSISEDPDEAVRVADAFADTTVSYLTQRQEDVRQDRLTAALRRSSSLEEEVRRLDQQVSAAGTDVTDSVILAQRDAAVREYSVAYESYRGLSDDDAQDINLTTLERAEPVPQQTTGFAPPRTRSTRVPIAAALGALLGAGVAVLAERLDSRLRDRRRAEQTFGMSVVAELPTLGRSQRRRELLVGPSRHGAVSEAFRSLRTSVTFLVTGGDPDHDDGRIGVIVVTSSSPADGKTTVVANLAAAFAETGRDVVAVNADFRRPTLASVLITGQRSALTAGLSGLGRAPADRYLVDTDTPGLRLLDLAPIGASAGDLTRATGTLLRSLRQHVDVIIVDTPPLAVTTEALEFAAVTDVLLLIGRVGKTSASGAQRAGELARFAGVTHLAAVLNDTGRQHAGRYYDDYYYGRSGGTGATTAEQHDDHALDEMDRILAHADGDGDQASESPAP